MLYYKMAKKVYVYSIIPGLSKAVSSLMPEIEIKTVAVINEQNRGSDSLQSDEIKQLEEAEVILADLNLVQEVYTRLHRVRWIQSTWAGYEGFASYLQSKSAPDFPITRLVTSRFSQLMTEYVIGQIIQHERAFLACYEAQVSSKWMKCGKIAHYRSLHDLTLAILGVGALGKEVARCLKSFGCTVYGYATSVPSEENKCEHVDRYWDKTELKDLLSLSDYVISILPSTPRTDGLLGNDLLKSALKSPVLINVGRGNVISENDILKALDAGWLSAAILDVFEEEPLPEMSRLWQHPNVVITPHVSAMSQPVDVALCFVENYKRFIQGLPLLHVIDWKKY